MYWFHEVFSESLESYLLARNFDKLTTVSQRNRNKQDGETVGSTDLETGKRANGKSWLHDSERWGEKVIQDDSSKLQYFRVIHKKASVLETCELFKKATVSHLLIGPAIYSLI